MARVPGAEGGGVRRQRICPKGPGDPSRQTIDGVAIYKYRPAPEAEGLAGYAVEFVVLVAAHRAAVLRGAGARRPFQVLQACNPPDTYWLLARLWQPRGVRFVFDQHDLNPELFLSRFGEPTALGGGCSSGAALAGADDLPHGRPRDLHQRVLPRIAIERGRPRRPTT